MPFRRSVLILCLPLLAACELETPALLTGGRDPTIAETCVARTARALDVRRDDIAVLRALSVPEGDVVTMAVPGTGTVRCTADVDGVIAELVILPPADPVAPAAPLEPPA